MPVASRGGPDRDGRALRHPHDDQALVRREAKEREALVLEVSWLALPPVRARAKRLALDDTAGTRTKEQASPRGGRVIGRDEDQPARHAEARKARERALGKTRGKKNVVYCKNLGNKKPSLDVAAFLRRAISYWYRRLRLRRRLVLTCTFLEIPFVSRVARRLHRFPRRRSAVQCRRSPFPPTMRTCSSGGASALSFSSPG